MAFANASLVPAAAADHDPANPASWGKIGRNEDCCCGSGKKYKLPRQICVRARIGPRVNFHGRRC
jgi:uncharacterized protein YecA (UPF0149 family)